ncbi:MAG: DUF2891 family protein [Hyphomonadaceae bacterium]|nr:MAG: Uncharacterized protein FD160_192 [Caulobacteraceae bacterium]MBT9445960.1 DUF2891 family protein [Hyphomonadaceae bacterium]TPW08059.1 MAG: Uncharacterized protein FD124_671 [Alphaproteobacteria bacterium]
MTISRTAGLFLAAIMLASCAAPAPTVSAPRETEMARALAEQAAYCAARTDTTHPVFHGCVDWHSAAHAHYALTAYERLTGDRAHAAFLDASLTSDGLAAERADILARPDFEQPYGRAWFLRLYVERKLVHGDDRLAPLARDIAQSLVDLYTRTPADPNARDYRSASFALINLLAYGRTVGDASITGFVERAVRTQFMAQDARCDLADEPRGFLSTCASWAWLVAEVATPAELATWYAAWNPGLETWTPVATPANAHQYGKNFSRAWGLSALYKATGDARYRDLYCAHRDAGYAQWTAKRDDYMAVGHWVAQFGMLALAEGREKGVACE